MQEINMETVQKQDGVSKVLLPYALICALVSILYYVGLYLNGAESFLKPIAYFSYIIPIGFGVAASIKAKKAHGYLTFSNALKLNFGIFVLSFFGVSIFSFFLFNYIDPAFAERMFQLTIQKSQEMLERFNIPQSEIDKQIKGVMSKDIFSFGAIMQNFFISCIVLFLVSLIIAAIVKKNKPEFTA